MSSLYRRDPEPNEYRLGIEDREFPPRRKVSPSFSAADFVQIKKQRVHSPAASESESSSDSGVSW